MTQYRIKYRAKGPEDYEFTFEWMAHASTWRVYIDRQPTYGRRSTSDHATHRLGISTRPYICWTTPLRTFEDAQAVAARWAECTQVYIATGSFPAPPRTLDTRDVSTTARLDEARLRTGRAGGAPAPASPASLITPTFPNPQPLTPPNRPHGPVRRLLERLS